MEEEYMDSQDGSGVDSSRDVSDNLVDSTKDFGDGLGYGDEGYDDEEGGNNFRGRGRGNFGNRGRGGPPPGWMNGPPMRFRGRGYGPGGPPMRGRGFFRGRIGPRGFAPNNGPNFDNNWGPMGPPPGMMGGPPPGMMGGPPPFGPPPGMMPPGGPMGPPPNMMGQPPPFGGPPGMPPPNMPAPELWVETKSDDGKFYYYHSRTRETTWTRPQEGPTCKVITQSDVEAMAAAAQNQVSASPQNVAMNGPMGGPGPMSGPPMSGPGPMPGSMSGPPMSGSGSMSGPMGMMPNGMMQPGVMPPGVPGNGVPPFMNQPPPWIKEGGKDKSQDDSSPAEVLNDDMPPGESAPMNQQPPDFMSSGNMMGFPGPGFPPSFPGAAGGPGGPGPWSGGPPGWGHWPPLVAQPPPSMNNNVPDSTTQIPGMSTSGTGTSNNAPRDVARDFAPQEMEAEPTVIPDSPTSSQPPPQEKETVMPPALAAAAAEWTTHRAPDGRPYYHHAAKQQSVWEKPQPLKEFEELQAIILKEKGERFMKEYDGKVVDLESDNEQSTEAGPSGEAEGTSTDKTTLDAEQQQKELADKEEKEKEKAMKAKQERRRPITSTPIVGTPWCVVWTGDGSVFFYNSAAHSSVWERPAVLMGRPDVDKAVTQPPATLLEHLQQRKEKETPSISSTTGNKSNTNGELKRAADSSSDDSPDSAKKTKTDDSDDKQKVVSSSLCGGANIDVGAEAAREAEVRAARERGTLPHHQRLRAFLHMLHEKEVSAFSTWEKELHKIVFDPRYLMLNSKERRQVFDQYVRDRAEEERKEKKNRLAQKKTAFKALMEEAKLHSKSSFSEFTSKHGRDERYKGIEKVRDRETYFNEHLAELRKREKEEKERVREQVKLDFIALLKEKGIDRHARWMDVKKKIDSDPKYKAVEGSSLREDYFKEYCKIVKEERKKEKDTKDKKRDRSTTKKEKRDKDRPEKEKDTKDKEDNRKSKKKDKTDEPPPAAKEPEIVEVDDQSDNESAARAKEARAQASIKEREREVQRALATSLRDRDKEREYHKRDEAVQHFVALLADLVRNPDLPWREAKKQLKKDHRYSLAELLSKDDKEHLFVQQTSNLASKRRDKLRALLQERGVTCTAHWRDVKAMLADEPTAPVYSNATQMEREFRDYQRDKQSAAKTAMRQLLLETRSITHKSLSAVKENNNALQHVLDALKHDARYTALDHIAEERQQIITSYLEELEKKGPPPPPTATEPSRRSKQ